MQRYWDAAIVFLVNEKWKVNGSSAQPQALKGSSWLVPLSPLRPVLWSCWIVIWAVGSSVRSQKELETAPRLPGAAPHVHWAVHRAWWSSFSQLRSSFSAGQVVMELKVPLTWPGASLQWCFEGLFHWVTERCSQKKLTSMNPELRESEVLQAGLLLAAPRCFSLCIYPCFCKDDNRN